MKAFRVYGKYTVDKKHKVWNKFTKDVLGEKEEDAIERVLSTLTGVYGIKRKYIKVEKVEEINPEDSDNPVIRYHFGV